MRVKTCAPLSKACAHFLKCVAGHAGADDPESKGSIPYGAVVAWGWSEGLPYTANRGWPEPVFTDGFFFGKIADDAMDGIAGVVQKLPAFQLHPDLEKPSTAARAGADAYAHMTVTKSTLERNWELIQAGSESKQPLGAFSSRRRDRQITRSTQRHAQ